MATTTTTMAKLGSSFSSGIPFSLFHKDSKAYSLRHLTEENKSFLWHQFMLDVLLHIPRLSTDIDDVIAVVEENLTNLTDADRQQIDNFRATYTTDQAIPWYTSDTFLYRTLNKTSRTLNSDGLIRFHRIVKDIDLNLKQLQAEQIQNGTLQFPLTVFRTQEQWDEDELNKLLASEGCLISMNTHLSTTRSYGVACVYADSGNLNTTVLFEITVQETENTERLQVFADITQYSHIKDEREVLFGMSSVFKVISIEQAPAFWYIQLELTHPEVDEGVQQLMNEAKNYLYQISGKQMPFIVFKQLFTATSANYARPLTELVKFFLSDVAQLFLVSVHKKEGRMKELIDQKPTLHALMERTSSDIIRQGEVSICLLFDLLNSFLYSADKDTQEPITFDHNDATSLLCFGGFLLLAGDCDKSIRYFQMLLKNDSINGRLKPVIQSMLAASYLLIKENEKASNYFTAALQNLQSSKEQSMPAWLTACIASSNTTLYQSDQPVNSTVDTLEPLMNEEHVDDEVQEKLRLLHVGHICFEQQKFIDALNYWEEAVEITSYMPTSMMIIFNGILYVQMAVTYFRLNNMPEALNTIEKAVKCMESYYSTTHRMLTGLYFLYGCYLMQNNKPCESIEYLEKSLKNPHFSTDDNFLGIVHTLLTVCYMQSGDLELAEQSCDRALKYKSATNITSVVGNLGEMISFLKTFSNDLCNDFIGNIVRNGLQIGRELLARTIPKFNVLPEITDEQMCTYDQLITFADYYRHQQDLIKAEAYYVKALEKMTEMEGKSLWNVYKKMARMNSDDNDRYKDYFIEHCSKYDENNPNHFEIIATLQTIMYKYWLVQDEFDLAFDCLMYGAFMTVKFLCHQSSIDSKYISDLFDDIFRQEQVTKVVPILTKWIQMYSIDCIHYIEQFVSGYFASDDLRTNLGKIVHHLQLDHSLNQLKMKYGDDHTSQSIVLFLDLLLQLLRQSIPSSDKPTLPFSKQALEFLATYKDETTPLFYLMKTFESLLLHNTPNSFIYLDKFRLNALTFERYQGLKEKISKIFEKIEEDRLRTCLQNIANKLVKQSNEPISVVRDGIL